ncbi:hypothetical protein GUJ93_ZPchr0010g7936 [Zizania palustris]|uniref:Uncharacterized protein n=1 Tax=Zizania palustris TaxID=103762 RepID=A0A8J5W8M8_ZIZPA|nr:hypothetical protein GUJ93_ZPchr0010g7936 [Zizania palustris]
MAATFQGIVLHSWKGKSHGSVAKLNRREALPEFCGGMMARSRTASACCTTSVRAHTAAVLEISLAAACTATTNHCLRSLAATLRRSLGLLPLHRLQTGGEWRPPPPSPSSQSSVGRCHQLLYWFKTILVSVPPQHCTSSGFVPHSARSVRCWNRELHACLDKIDAAPPSSSPWPPPLPPSLTRPPPHAARVTAPRLWRHAATQRSPLHGCCAMPPHNASRTSRSLSTAVVPRHHDLRVAVHYLYARAAPPRCRVVPRLHGLHTVAAYKRLYAETGTRSECIRHCRGSTRL